MVGNWDHHDTDILIAILALDEPYAAAIADEVGLTRRPVTDRLKRMQENGLVERPERNQLTGNWTCIEYELTADGWEKYRAETMDTPMQGVPAYYDPDARLL